MLSDKNNVPFGIKLIEFFLYNIFWFLVFAIIYGGFDITKWWVIENMWGRIILIFLELALFEKCFGKNKNNKNESNLP